MFGLHYKFPLSIYIYYIIPDVNFIPYLRKTEILNVLEIELIYKLKMK